MGWFRSFNPFTLFLVSTSFTYNHGWQGVYLVWVKKYFDSEFWNLHPSPSHNLIPLDCFSPFTFACTTGKMHTQAWLTVALFLQPEIFFILGMPGNTQLGIYKKFKNFINPLLQRINTLLHKYSWISRKRSNFIRVYAQVTWQFFNLSIFIDNLSDRKSVV